MQESVSLNHSTNSIYLSIFLVFFLSFCLSFFLFPFFPFLSFPSLPFPFLSFLLSSSIYCFSHLILFHNIFRFTHLNTMIPLVFATPLQQKSNFSRVRILELLSIYQTLQTFKQHQTASNIMISWRIEKAGFSKQKKKHQTQNHHKNSWTGRITKTNKIRTRKKNLHFPQFFLSVLGLLFVFLAGFFVCSGFIFIFCETLYSLCCWGYKSNSLNMSVVSTNLSKPLCTSSKIRLSTFVHALCSDSSPAGFFQASTQQTWLSTLTSLTKQLCF